MVDARARYRVPGSGGSRGSHPRGCPSAGSAGVGRAVSVAMAEGTHPVPFRTRKLSPPAPMVLPWRRGGRVGRRRDIVNEGPPVRRGPFVVSGAGRAATDRGWVSLWPWPDRRIADPPPGRGHLVARPRRGAPQRAEGRERGPRSLAGPPRPPRAEPRCRGRRGRRDGPPGRIEPRHGVGDAEVEGTLPRGRCSATGPGEGFDRGPSQAQPPSLTSGILEGGGRRPTECQITARPRLLGSGAGSRSEARWGRSAAAKGGVSASEGPGRRPVHPGRTPFLRQGRPGRPGRPGLRACRRPHGPGEGRRGGARR